MKKSAIALTFNHQVTRDELVASLDHILKLHGCTGCGLNGWDGVFFRGDHEPFISQVRQDLLKQKISSVLKVEALPERFEIATDFN